MPDSVVDELLALNQRLLDSIAAADWETYAELCHPSLTCFEPEARGHLVEGMPFHRFYFELGGARKPHRTTMSQPHVRIMGDAAVVSYVRLNQRVDAEGRCTTTAVEETRVWQKIDGRWRHVHFHRSLPAT
jgi:calcium/calmodulin-dependent protein kinase (CaM kinase) II